MTHFWVNLKIDPILVHFWLELQTDPKKDHTASHTTPTLGTYVAIMGDIVSSESAGQAVRSVSA